MTELDIDALVEGAVTSIAKMPSGAFLGEEDPSVKIALFGPPGSGKTRVIVDLLLLGERLFVVSSDPGGNGLATVRNELKRLKRLDLLKNIFYVDVTEFVPMVALWNDPYKHYGDALKKLDPTIAMWEGFSSFQVQSIDEYVMPDQLRPEKGGDDKYDYWDKVRRASMRVHGKFLAARGRVVVDGKYVTEVDDETGESYYVTYPWHHILTCHEQEAQDANSQQKRKASPDRPWVQGQASKMIEAAYDLIIQTSLDEDEFDFASGTTKLVYKYRVSAPSKETRVKSRGYDLPSEFPASMSRVWKEVTGRSESNNE